MEDVLELITQSHNVLIPQHQVSTWGDQLVKGMDIVAVVAVVEVVDTEVEVVVEADMVAVAGAPIRDRDQDHHTIADSEVQVT